MDDSNTHRLSTDAEVLRGALEQALAWAYTQGAWDVHAEWLANPGDAPRGDPDFSEAASDYAEAAVNPFSSAARIPAELIAALSLTIDSSDGGGDTALQAETYRDMHEIATQQLGYPSILEALEAAPPFGEQANPAHEPVKHHPKWGEGQRAEVNPWIVPTPDELGEARS